MIARFLTWIGGKIEQALRKLRAAQYRLEKEIAEIDRDFRA